jgi:hypothetical protein
VPEEALIRAVRAVLSQQPAIVAQHPATPAPTLSPLAALDKEDANMARIFRAVGQGIHGEIKSTWTISEGLDVMSHVDELLMVFSIIHYVRLGRTVARWDSDWSTALHDFAPRTSSRGDAKDKALIVDAALLRQRYAAKAFRGHLVRVLRDGLPRENDKDAFFEVIHVGIQLMEIMATRVFEGFGAGGAQVLVRFAGQWQKGVLDVEALWPRRRQSGSFRD